MISKDLTALETDLTNAFEDLADVSIAEAQLADSARVLLRTSAQIRDEFAFDLREIDFALPFSWWLFYAAAVAFFVGQQVYIRRCPRLVRSYVDFGEYKRAHVGMQEFRYQLYLLLTKDLAGADRHKMWKTIGGSEGVWDPATLDEQVLAMQMDRFLCEKQIPRNNPEEEVAGMFWEVRAEATRSWDKSRKAAFLLFHVGMLLFVIVGLQNFWAVCKLLAR